MDSNHFLLFLLRVKSINLVWFKKDLRTFDNEALNEGLKAGPVVPIFVIEPNLWKLPDHSSRQWEFVRESLVDLKHSLNDINLKLLIRVGNVQDVIKELMEIFHIQAIYSHEETGNKWTFQRDQKLRCFTKKERINWYEFRQVGVFRGLKTRRNWSSKWEQHMSQELIKKPNRVNFLIDIPSHILPSSKSLNLNIDECSHRIKGGRKQGLNRLDDFLKFKIDNYQYSLSSPLKAFDGCSRLSPYLTWGCLSIREVVQAIRKTKKNGSRAIDSRLHWHCHFIQKLEDEPEIEFKNMHSSYNKLRNETDNDLFFERWKKGSTGYPMVDACMRSLIKTGWLNFRMRAMLMSFASYHLWLPWQITSKYLATLFTDYEPGIHYSQSQMQSGTTGINAIRIYNPIKQGVDHDPEGIFIRKWVPELKNVPKKYIHMPWKDVNYIREYNFPIVEESESRKTAASKIYKLRKEQSHKIESNKIYIKHGSRKPRVKKIKKNIEIKKAEIQKNLF